MKFIKKGGGGPDDETVPLEDPNAIQEGLGGIEPTETTVDQKPNDEEKTPDLQLENKEPEILVMKPYITFIKKDDVEEQLVEEQSKSGTEQSKSGTEQSKSGTEQPSEETQSTARKFAAALSTLTGSDGI